MDDSTPRRTPRWLSKAKRLFPHPLLAGVVCLACLLLTVIFTGVVVFERVWAAAPFVVVLLGGAIATAAATVSEVNDWRLRRGPAAERAAPTAPTFAVIVLLISVYAWMLTAAVHVFEAFFRNGLGSYKYWITVGIAVAATVYMQFHGKRVVREHFGTRGGRNLELTGRQALYVLCLALAFGFYATWLSL